ncbi:alpha/beta fold hydrolase [Nocardia altamirensis]|uniref:alpha/beta fold hydrolase n=1 Tax=Nocardia altamirensis TaxID=472158 RepID=UPI001FE13F6D|nr:lipase family protein [Nocardia altamirensis]
MTVAPASAASVPGTVIDVLPQVDGWRGTNGSSVVEYWTTGSDGTAQPVSGAVLMPDGPAPAGGWPVLAFAHGSFGLGPGCGGQSDPARGPWPERRAIEDGFLRSFLGKGFAVLATDYLGLGRFDTGTHPYLELKTEAAAIIDLVKAARSRIPALSKTWMVFGGSQGGQAALGAAYLQRTYAPELDFRGSIAIDPESEAENLLPMAGPWGPDLPSFIGDALNVFFTSVLAGVRVARPDADIDSFLTPRGREILDAVGSLCQDQIAEVVKGVRISELLAKPLLDERLHAVLTEYMGVPTHDYTDPILLLFNVTDIAVPAPLHAALVGRLTASRVEFKTVVGTGQHLQINHEMRVAIDTFLARVRSAAAGAN